MVALGLMSNFTTVASAVQMAQSSFAVSLLQSQVANQSFVLSPFSISIALGMVCLGAKSQTATEIRSAIAQNATDTEMHSHFAAALKQLKSPYIVLTVANGVFVNDRTNVLQTFRAVIRKYYKGQFQKVDFTKSEIAAKKINNFAKLMTNGKIKELVNADSLGPSTALVLANAVYFNAKWDVAFDSSWKNHRFYISKNEVKEVEMIANKGQYIYQKESGYQVVGIPYKNEKAHLFIILPSEIDGVYSLVETMDGSTFAQILSNREKHLVHLSMPTFETNSDFDLKPILESMGITSMFSSNTADFSGIDRTESLYVDAVMHKAFIKVSQKGTEAAASTLAKVVLSSYTKIDYIAFDADHPFLYAVVDDNRNILFCGIMT